MLAYAAHNPRPAGRAGSTKALTLVIAGHAALIAAVLTARPEWAGPIIDHIPEVVFVEPEAPPPQPPPPRTDERTPVQDPSIDQRTPIVILDKPIGELPVEPHVPTDLGLPPGGDPIAQDPPKRDPVRVGVRFATAAGSIKPPYPNDKLRLEEEATLRLRLTIDARGRVTAVEPVGRADPSFLEAARRHILRAWRYKPAMENGVAVPSTTVISLSFRLEEA